MQMYMCVHMNIYIYVYMWAFPKLEEPYWCPYDKGILRFGGSVLGVPYFWKPPYVLAVLFQPPTRYKKGPHKGFGFRV